MPLFYVRKEYAMYYCRTYHAPIGQLTLASDGDSLTGLWLQGQKFFAQNHCDPVERPELPVLQDTAAWLDRYFAGEKVAPGLLPLKPEGTAFQRRVWDILLTIPYGQTVTYGQIAKLLDCPGASQAVGAAVGHNPISVIIPCHRVLGSNGKLTGYAGGLQAKAMLLQLEGVLTSEEIQGFLTGIPL